MESFSKWDATKAGAVGAIAFGLVIVVLILQQAYAGGNIAFDLVYELGAAAAGGLFSWGVAKLKQAEEDEDRANALISSIVESWRGGGKSQPGWHKRILEEINANYVSKHKAVQILRVLERVVDASRERWNESFALLTQCPDFHYAWNSFFILRKDIASASDSAGELGKELGLEEGEKPKCLLDCAGAGKKARRKAQAAWRPLKAAISRRDESFSDIPSLGTLALNGSDGADSERRHWMKLARFWDLFKVVSADMRDAYIILYHIVEEKLDEEIQRDIGVCEKTLGACLERIRNCLLILADKSAGEKEDFAKEEDSNEEGNTTISEKDLKELVSKAKKLERGEVIDQIQDLPASFGVMIRDLATAYGIFKGGEFDKGPDKESDSGNRASV